MATTIPSTQKAQLIRDFGLNLELAEVSVPEPNDDELLVHLLYSGVCHTDIAIMTNKFPAPFPLQLPLVAGHEGTGVVVKMGKNVTQYTIGDRVGVTVRVINIRKIEKFSRKSLQW
jgi:alcohol dehydrogenase, propanol-preferring